MSPRYLIASAKVWAARGSIVGYTFPEVLPWLAKASASRSIDAVSELMAEASFSSDVGFFAVFPHLLVIYVIRVTVNKIYLLLQSNRC